MRKTTGSKRLIKDLQCNVAAADCYNMADQKPRYLLKAEFPGENMVNQLNISNFILANISGAGPAINHKKKAMYSAIITGGAQGIGKAITLNLIREGIFTFILDNDQEALEDFNQENQEKITFQTILCDVSDGKQLERLLSNIQSQQPNIRYLVNNAAVSEFKPMEKLTLEEWNKTLATNLSSYFLTVKFLADNLRQNNGAVVNICSTRAFMSEPNTEAYSASKGGVFSLTHAQAMSLSPKVRVNCISPGWIDVTSWKKKQKRENIHWAEKHHLQHPSGRIGQPEDVATMTWFLLSDASGFITGQNFFIDGGMTRKMIYEEG